MPISDDPSCQYNMTSKMCVSEPEPPFETLQEVTRMWGRNWGVDNDVGQIRSVLLHRPGVELSIVDTSKRIDELGTYGGLEAGSCSQQYHYKIGKVITGFIDFVI